MTDTTTRRPPRAETVTSCAKAHRAIYEARRLQTSNPE